MEQVLSMIGLAQKAGRIAVGEEPVGTVARAKRARLMLLAADAAPASCRRAASFAAVGNCPLLTIGADKDALGRALGRTSVAMAAVTDFGLAAAIVQKLAAQNESAYGETAALLAQRARRAQQRRQEKLRHEKNVRLGKHRKKK